MRKILFLSSAIIIILIASSAHSGLKVTPAVNDVLAPARSAQLTGFVAAKLNASYQNRILSQNIDKLVFPFTTRSEDRCWQSEFWGKWFTSAVLAYRYRPEPELKAKLDTAISALLATQSPDGYIGNYADDKHLLAWDIWGRKYCMLGLISYYDLTKDENSLLAAQKLANHLINELTDTNNLIVKLGSHRGMAASSILEPICLLYARNGHHPYLTFAEEIVRQWETTDGPQLLSKSGVDVAKRFPNPENWWGWEQGQKAYEMMSCYEGLLELYRLTGKPEYLDAVKKTWQNIMDTEINITGSGSGKECWFGGKELQTISVAHYQETCVSATWIKLSQQLFRLTADAKYADAIEHTWYNALLGAMYSDGSDWAKYSNLAGQRLHGSGQCGMDLNCCVASGPRGLFTLPLTAVMSDAEGIHINFFAGGIYKLQTPRGKPLEIVQQTDYPVTGEISLNVIPAKEEEFVISIRIPQWSKKTLLKVNGQQIEGVVCGKFMELSRKWKQGDLITLSLDMRGRIMKMGNSPGYMAIQRGPVTLARDARIGTTQVDATIQPLTDAEGYINLEVSENKPDNIWMCFNALFIVESHSEGENPPVKIGLCDYASAGNTLNAESWYRVWMGQSFDPAK